MYYILRACACVCVHACMHTYMCMLSGKMLASNIFRLEIAHRFDLIIQTSRSKHNGPMDL